MIFSTQIFEYFEYFILLCLMLTYFHLYLLFSSVTYGIIIKTYSGNTTHYILYKTIDQMSCPSKCIYIMFYFIIFWIYFKEYIGAKARVKQFSIVKN